MAFYERVVCGLWLSAVFTIMPGAGDDDAMTRMQEASAVDSLPLVISNLPSLYDPFN